MKAINTNRTIIAVTMAVVTEEEMDGLFGFYYKYFGEIRF